MGKGNVGCFGKYETQYYIDNGDYHMYIRYDENLDEYIEARERDIDFNDASSTAWSFSPALTDDQFNQILEGFKTRFKEALPSFDDCPENTYLPDNAGRMNRHAIMENQLFYIALEDNEWSTAVEIIQKTGPYGDDSLVGLQAGHFDTVNRTLKECLLEEVPQIHTRNGAWMSGTIKREDVIA